MRSEVSVVNSPTQTNATVLPPVDELRKFWPKPKFRKLAESGDCSVRCALVHMCIYESLGSKPATIDFVDLRIWEWPPLWREAILLMKAFWEDREEDLEKMEREIHSRLRSMVASPEGKDIAYCAGGRATRSSVTPILPLRDRQEAKAKYHEQLGWPYNEGITDKDAFDVWRFKERGTGRKYYRPVRWDGARRAAWLEDEGIKYGTRAEAEAVLPDLVHAFLAKFV